MKYSLAATAATAALASAGSIPLKSITPKNIKGMVESGKARLAHWSGSTADASGTVTNDDVSYVAPVNIGGATWELIVDTGSSNTWCGARTSCEPTSSGKATGGTVSVPYGSGSFSGNEYTDAVSFAGLTVSGQSIGAAKTSTGFSTVDGIIGFGPVDLTENTVSNANTVPTFMDNLYSQGSIPVEVLGVSFAPEPGSSTSSNNGELTLGGTDASRYSGSISYFPKLTSGEASLYWGLSTSFKYGSTALASGSQCIIDTGTTLIYIPQTAFKKFLTASGGKVDASSGLVAYTKQPTQNFNVVFGGHTFALTPSQYLIPQAQYSNFGLSSGKYYAWINNGGSGTVNCIVGQKFMEQYYAVFDTTNSRIGFATSAVSST